MTRFSPVFALIAAPLALLVATAVLQAQPPAPAGAAFDSYVARLESQLEHQRQSGSMDLAGINPDSLRRGDLVIEKRTPASEADPPGAMLHDWRGTAFAPGATAADFERLMRNFNGYVQVYSPQVVRSAVLARQGDHYQVKMRLRQKHVITVVLDTTCDVTFGREGGQRGYSISRSTHIAEIDAPGTARERSLPDAEGHGFLWRLDTWWTYEEHDGGLYLQIESVSLTRAIPPGLGWAVRPFVESVPRESLEFTLRRTCDALRNQAAERRTQ